MTRPKELTNQQVFDRVVKHLARQGRQSGEIKPSPLTNRPSVVCNYRMTHEGKVLRCAVGCLIPKAKYNPKIEGCTIGNRQVQDSLDPRIPRTILTLSLLNQLQMAHDNSFALWELHIKLTEVALDWELDASKLELITQWERVR